MRPLSRRRLQALRLLPQKRESFKANLFCTSLKRSSHADGQVFRSRSEHLFDLVDIDRWRHPRHGCHEVEGSSLPLSVIVIGVGNADFSQMEELDSDGQVDFQELKR